MEIREQLLPWFILGFTEGRTLHVASGDGTTLWVVCIVTRAPLVSDVVSLRVTPAGRSALARTTFNRHRSL